MVVVPVPLLLMAVLPSIVVPPAAATVTLLLPLVMLVLCPRILLLEVVVSPIMTPVLPAVFTTPGEVLNAWINCNGAGAPATPVPTETVALPSDTFTIEVPDPPDRLALVVVAVTPLI